MDALFVQCLNQMESWFRELETLVPQPVKVPYLHHFVFRYKEKSLEQALIQKLARVVTGLHSARLLLNNGFLQEQAAIHRILDEFQQDISFLSLARLMDDFTNLHQQYLDAFYEEEFDKPEDPLSSTQKRPSVPQRKIRAYIAKKEAESGVGDAGRGAEISRTLSKAYSGFVHGASPHILSMYGGFPSRFHISGMLGTPHEYDHRRDIWNYFYRGILSFSEVALVLNKHNLFEEIRKFSIVFEEAAAKDYTKRSQEET